MGDKTLSSEDKMNEINADNEQSEMKSGRDSTEPADDVVTGNGTNSVDDDDNNSEIKKPIPSSDTNVNAENNNQIVDVAIEAVNLYEGSINITQIDEKCTSKLTQGLMENVLPGLETAKVSLEEALKNQEVLIETVQQENTKFAECVCMGNIAEMMQDSKLYFNKLLSVKKEMNMLTERTAKLKRRAVKLQQQKQKEEQYMIQRRERELEREQQLIARVVKKPDSQTEN